MEMTAKELIQALRHCASDDEYGCLRCPGESTCDECTGKSLLDAADRLEALLDENERLRSAVKKLWCGKRYCTDAVMPSTEGVE